MNGTGRNGWVRAVLAGAGAVTGCLLGAPPTYAQG